MKKQRSAISSCVILAGFAGLLIWFYLLVTNNQSILSVLSNSRATLNDVTQESFGKEDKTPASVLQLKKRNRATASGNNKTMLLTSSNNQLSSSSALKIILLWSTWSSTMADEPLVKAGCPVTSCVFTADMSLIHQSDVVVLYVVYVDTLTDFPINRRPDQRFVFAQLEPPENTKMATINDPRLCHDYFNWTMTYRRDSDVFLRDYYGSVVKRTNKTQTTTNSSLDRFKSSRSYQEMEPLIKGKSKLVAWFVAHCSTPIQREEYVRQSGQFVTVDIYGRCGKECPSNCDDMLRTDYKFYLAFENSWCPDYVTEKLIRPLAYDSVPIVLGGANYSHFAPPHSYIDARKFDSAKELADYLMMLDKSGALYARYFDWKRNYDISLLDLSGWCELCRMAHDETFPAKVYHDIKRWWMLDGGECQSDSIKYF